MQFELSWPGLSHRADLKHAEEDGMHLLQKSKKAQYTRKRCWAASERKMGEEKEKEESGQRKLKTRGYL